MTKRLVSFLILIGIMIALCACGTQSFLAEKEGLNFETLSKTGSVNLEYAKMYTVDEYGEYYLVSFNDGSHLFIVPDGGSDVYNLPDNTTVVRKPLSKVYLASSSVMDMICKIGALDAIKMTGTKQNDWHIDEPVAAMKEQKLKYAGKYSQPDYEMIIDDGCDFAIENTMIWHSPVAKEKLEELGIPVMVELSSYEEHPLGRLEWIRLYGILFDRQSEADAFFKGELSKADEYGTDKGTGRKVAYFYINANGAVNIKKSDDYIPKMIEMAGGIYTPTDKNGKEESAMSSTNMQFEEFYASAKDADVLIYNSTTTGDVGCIDDIIGKNTMLKDFDAVKSGNVYLSGADFYQKTTGICDMIKDLNIVINDGNMDDLTFLRKLEYE